jgi:hypothetical protein
MRYHLLRLIAILAVLLVALWPLNALAVTDPGLPANISGYEVFPGIPNGGNTYGTTFAGWVGGGGAGPGDWVPCPKPFTCGGWTVVINYYGTPGFGSSVSILTGGWFLRTPNPNGHSYSGTLATGTVTWPSLSSDSGCGTGVAVVSATLSGGANSFNGCLDDMSPGHPFPPHIWGTIS